MALREVHPLSRPVPMLCLLALCAVPFVRAAVSSGPNCHDKVLDFVGCLNKTMSEKHSPSAKLQLVKLRVNQCLQKSKCARIYIDAVQNDEDNEEGEALSRAQKDRRNIHACMRDFHAASVPSVRKCVAEIVPDADTSFIGPRENKWMLIQQAKDKTRVKNLCGRTGNATNASNCIDQVFTPNARVRMQQQQRIRELCAAIHECQIGMGVCRTVVDNGRKAICDCTARRFEDFDRLKKEVPSCANVTSAMVKASRRLHSPFVEDCGPDPCDRSFQSLTPSKGDEESSAEGDADADTGNRKRLGSVASSH